MPNLTHFGGFVLLFGVCVIVIILSMIFKKNNIKKIAILCLISLLLADGIALLLKYLVHEPRPFISLDNVRLLITEDDLNSFPSGHTTSTFAVITTLIYKIKNKYWDVLLVAFGVLIGVSRIYVGVHYPLDVLCGALVGICSAIFVCKFIYEKLGF